MCKTKFNSICRYVLTIKIFLIMYWCFFIYKCIYFGCKSLGKPFSGATAEVTILSSIYFIFCHYCIFKKYAYTCQLSRLRRESHACGLKTSISRPLTPADQFLTPD